MRGSQPRLPPHWTAQAAALAESGGYRHFRLLGRRGRGSERAIELSALLDPGFRLVVPLQRLRDRLCWHPGWQQLPDQGSGQG
ncbi:MAG: TIGR02450 family Trp-rich protein, partial [Cyanobacteria bacterium]|nr:TIGR02450 family Trp-rich protein [Cyanobacteriota bacterium]